MAHDELAAGSARGGVSMIDQRLREAAMTDPVVQAAISHILRGGNPIDALTAAVLELAAWKRAWSPEVIKAMLLAPPAPITLCCAGTHWPKKEEG